MTPKVCVDCGTPMAYRRPLPAGVVRQSTATQCQNCRRLHNQNNPRPAGTVAGITFAGRADILEDDGIIDPIAVERAANCDTSIRLTRRELDAAIDSLTDRGHSSDEIADRLGCDERTVQRRRAMSQATPIMAAA